MKEDEQNDVESDFDRQSHLKIPLVKKQRNPVYDDQRYLQRQDKFGRVQRKDNLSYRKRTARVDGGIVGALSAAARRL